MASLKGGSLAEFLALKLKMSSISGSMLMITQNFIMVLRIYKMLSNPLQTFS